MMAILKTLKHMLRYEKKHSTRDICNLYKLTGDFIEIDAVRRDVKYLYERGILKREWDESEKRYYYTVNIGWGNG